VKIHLPTHPSQVKLSTYVAFKVAKDDVERVIAITGLSRKQALGLQPATISEIILTFSTAAGKSGEFTRHLKIRSAFRTMRLSLIPDLSKMPTGQHIDADEYSKMVFPADNKKADWSKLPVLMGTLYQPLSLKIGKWYRVVEYDSEYGGHMGHIMAMNMEQVNAALLFFSSIVPRLQDALLESIQNQIAQEMKRTQSLVSQL
jgi:hypothetical protein